MPIYVTDDLYEGGLRGIQQFVGTLATWLPDQYNEKFDNEQTHFLWESVHIEKANEPVELEDDKYKDFVKQSERPRSTWGYMLKDWQTFAAANDMEITKAKGFADFVGKRIRWTRATYTFGSGGNMSPGLAFIPSEILDDKAKVLEAEYGYTPPEKGEGTSPAGAKEVSPETISGITAVVTEPMDAAAIKQAYMKDTKTRVEIAKAGGIDHVLEAVVAAGALKIESADGETLFSAA